MEGGSKVFMLAIAVFGSVFELAITNNAPGILLNQNPTNIHPAMGLLLPLLITAMIT
jgi:hypothetical protein